MVLLAHELGNLHATTAAVVLLFVTGLHMPVALSHRIVLHDRALRRMTPCLVEGSVGDAILPARPGLTAATAARADGTNTRLTAWGHP